MVYLGDVELTTKLAYFKIFLWKSFFYKHKKLDVLLN